MECCVKRAPAQKRLVLLKVKGILKVILDQSKSCQKRFFQPK